MISESGALTDPNELAAALTPEEITAIENSSLEALLADLGKIEGVADQVGLGELPESELSPAFESLMGIVHDIRESGGISRGDAAVIANMTASLEGFEHTFDHMPMASFTEMPSKVNFAPSMESVLATVGRKIIDIIKAIIQWVRDKAKSFVGMFRDNRIKAKQTEVASNKVSEALKVSGMKVSDLFKAGDSVDATVGVRKPGVIATLSISALAGRLTYSHSILKYVHNSLQRLSNEVSRVVDSQDAGMPSLANQLDKLLFDKPTDYSHTNKGDPGVYGLDYLAAITTRLRGDVANVDVITTTDPEGELNSRLAMYDGANLVPLANSIAGPLLATAAKASTALKEVETKIAEYTKQNIRLSSDDPLYKSARRCKAVVQAVDDINSVYGYVMKSWSDLITVSARVVRNPSYGMEAAA